MNIYVGNLAYSVTAAELKAVFAPYGEVTSAEVIVDKRSGRSRGYGFVRMASDEQGRAAVTALNGKEVQGRNLRVDESRPDDQKRPRGGNRNARGGRAQRPARDGGTGRRGGQATPAPQPTGARPDAGPGNDASPRKAGFFSRIKALFG